MGKNKSGSAAKPNKIILSRTLILMMLCGVVAFIVLAVKLYDIQITKHEEYEHLAVEQQTRETTVTASRGTITDRNGNALAISATAETVYISPYEMQLYEESPELIASGLSSILGVDYDAIIEKSKDTASWYKTVAVKIETDLADKVRAFKSENKLKSIHIETDSKRYYPYSSLACQVIGFVGTDNYGLEGVEALYNNYLEGTNGSIVRLTTADGAEMLYSKYQNYNDAIDGDSMSLTIDVTAQYIADKNLKQAIKDYDVQNGGCCVVMNVKTGEILAMASQGDYDLNNYLEIDEEKQQEIDAIQDETERKAALKEALFSQQRNKALSDTYEPGSVFKIITLATALDLGAVDEDDTFYCGGSINVIGRTPPLHCWKTAGHGSQTLKQAVQNSCNVAFVQIGQKIGAENFYKYIEAFGLFDKTGIDLSGEATSMWWPKDVFCDEDNLSQLASTSFGQTFNITPIQMLTAVCAAVNGGYLMEPYVVSQMTASDGTVVYSKEPTVVRQVISEETSKTVREILESVVGEAAGTGKNAHVAGYRIGGKTGTSEKTAQYVETGVKDYQVSFCGFAPANDPEVAVLLILDSPSKDTGIYISGGVMAAPAVGNIMSELLPYLGYEPNYSEEEQSRIDLLVPALKNKTVTDASDNLNKLGLEVKIVGTGDTVTDQLPKANAEVAAGTTVILYAGEAVPEKEVTVPNVYGLTVGAARDKLELNGLYLDTSGASPTDSSVVVSYQSAEAGSTADYGSVIQVTLVANTELGRY